MPFEKPTVEQLSDRYMHNTPTPEQWDRYSAVRRAVFVCSTVCVAMTPVSPEQTRALNALDEAMFLFNSAIARHDKETT